MPQSPSTIAGVRLSVVSPTPSCAWVFWPQASREPSADTARVWYSPQATDTTRTPRRPRTVSGRGANSPDWPSPCADWPNSFDPQDATSPPSRIATLCSNPQATCVRETVPADTE